MNELIEALLLIHRTCTNNDYCEKCPMGNSAGECLVNCSIPSEWLIVEPVERVMM